MPHWRTLSDQTRLGAWDFLDDDGNPRPRTAEITSVESERLEGRAGIKASRKPVLSFKGTEKKLIAGATICKTIEQMYGPNTKNWIGKRVTLYATTTTTREGEVACVRVKNQIPKQRAEPIPSMPVNEEMREAQVKAAESYDRPVPAGAEEREPGQEG